MTLIVTVLTACHAPLAEDPGPAIRQVMADQEAAWDRGDIPAFMNGYSDTVCFVSEKGRNCGKAVVSANYQRNYPNKEAMGDLTFAIHEVIPAGPGFAWLTGTWELQRAADTLGGGFSLLWVKGTGAWKIVRDHTY